MKKQVSNLSITGANLAALPVQKKRFIDRNNTPLTTRLQGREFEFKFNLYGFAMFHNRLTILKILHVEEMLTE